MGRRADGEGTITQRQDGTWMGQISLGYDDSGKRKRKTVYGKTQKEVRAKVDEVKQQLASGTFSDTKLTVRQYLEQWHTEKAREVRPRTVELYRLQAEKHIYPRIGRIKLDKLTPLHLQSMCGEIADEVGARTAELCRVQMVGALKQAVRWGLIARNPADAVNPIKVNKQEIKIWNPADAAKLLDASQGHRLYALFYLAMSTGMRRGELLALRWNDVRGSTVHVRQSKTRKGVRRIALSPDVLAVLDKHRERQDLERSFLAEVWPDTGLVFPSEVGTPIEPGNLRRTWVTLQKQAGVTQIRLHDLRHLHASMLIVKGKKSPIEVADRLGHTNPSFTLDVYGHLFEEVQQEEAMSILEFLPQPSSGPLN